MSDSQTADIPRVEDRRRSPRFPCSLDIAIEWGAAHIPGAVKEISAEGMFVELDGPLWIGARFAARLAILAGEPVVVDCVVRRVVPRSGMGLTFTASQESGRVAVSTLIKRLAAQ